VGFNRFLVGQLNERLGQFIALLEYGRTLDATARLARCIATLFNLNLYPDLMPHLEITQEEIGALPDWTAAQQRGAMIAWGRRRTSKEGEAIGALFVHRSTSKPPTSRADRFAQESPCTKTGATAGQTLWSILAN
jgi:hypothetical protein